MLDVFDEPLVVSDCPKSRAETKAANSLTYQCGYLTFCQCGYCNLLVSPSYCCVQRAGNAGEFSTGRAHVTVKHRQDIIQHSHMLLTFTQICSEKQYKTGRKRKQDTNPLPLMHEITLLLIIKSIIIIFLLLLLPYLLIIIIYLNNKFMNVNLNGFFCI